MNITCYIAVYGTLVSLRLVTLYNVHLHCSIKSFSDVIESEGEIGDSVHDAIPTPRSKRI
jgi:hypothetical protein